MTDALVLRAAHALGGAVLLALLAACAAPPVVVDRADTSPPALRIGSVNLAPDVSVSASGADAWQGSPVAPGATEFSLSATANDAESGIASVELTGELRAWCGSSPGAVAGLARVAEPLSATNAAQPAADGSLPSSLTAIVTVPLNRIRALCPAGRVLVDYQADVRAQAVNGAGSITTGPAASAFNGPAALQVAVLNAFAPCLRELENPFGDEVSYRVVCEGLKVEFGTGVILTGGNRRMSRDSVLDRWGSFFATRDIVLINEVSQADTRWLDRMRTRMPGFHVAHRGMTAILSRWPLRDVRDDILTYTYPNPGGLPFDVSSEYVRATLDAPGRPLVVYSVHWAHRPAPPDTAPQRERFAERTVLDLGTLDPRTPVILGGDFNTKSNFIGENGSDLDSADARDEHARFLAQHGGASMPEVARLEWALTDARAEMVRSGRMANYRHGFGWPVDRLYHGGGQYVATDYDNTRGDIATPSDHPMLLFTLSRVKGPTP